jgi:hypothetical protein
MKELDNASKRLTTYPVQTTNTKDAHSEKVTKCLEVDHLVGPTKPMI